MHPVKLKRTDMLPAGALYHSLAEAPADIPFNSMSIDIHSNLKDRMKQKFPCGIRMSHF